LSKIVAINFVDIRRFLLNCAVDIVKDG